MKTKTQYTLEKKENGVAVKLDGKIVVPHAIDEEAALQAIWLIEGESVDEFYIVEGCDVYLVKIVKKDKTMEKLPRVILFDLENEKGVFYAISEISSCYEGIILTTSTETVIGKEAIMPINYTKIYLGDIEPEWQLIIDEHEKKQAILNSAEPVEDYLAQRSDKAREFKREMANDSEPFTVTEQETEGLACVEEVGINPQRDYEGEIERLVTINSELTQHNEDLESECEFLSEENFKQRAVIEYLENIAMVGKPKG